MPDSLRPFISRILGSIIGGFAAWLYAKYGFTMDNESQAALIATIITVFNLAFTIVHRTIDKKVNPGDTASSHLALASKIAVDQIKDPDVHPIYPVPPTPPQGF